MTKTVSNGKSTKKATQIHASEPEEIQFQSVKDITSHDALRCLRALIRFLQEKELREVWLSPFLRTLTDEMPFLADYERKELISKLELFGAIKVEKREGDPYPYSVILINYNHNDVKTLME